MTDVAGIRPSVVQLNPERRVTVTIDVNDPDGHAAATETYEDVHLPAGRTATSLPEFAPSLQPDTYYAIEYTVR